MKWRGFRIAFILLLGGLAVFELDRMYLRPARQLDAVNASHHLDENRAACTADAPERLYVGNSIIHALRDTLGLSPVHEVWSVPGEFALNLPKWLPKISEANPDTLIMQLGINDLLSGQQVFRVEKHLEEVMFLCDSLQTVALFPGILSTELAWSPYVRPKSLRARITSLDDWLAKTVSLHPSSHYLNFPIQFPPAGYTSDGVHLNETGKTYWLRYLERGIDGLKSK